MIDSSSHAAPISPPSSRRWKLQIPIRLSRQSTTSHQQQSPRRGGFPIFFNRTKNYTDEEEEKKEEIDENDDNTTRFEIESLPILMMSSNSMTAAVTTTTASTENVDPSDDCCSVLVEPPSFTNLSSFQILSPIIKHRDLDHMDDSFQTEVTVSDELSLSDEDDINNIGNQDTSFPPSSGSSSNSNSNSNSIDEDNTHNNTSFQSSGGVRFADEIGLPMEHVLHYKCDREQREHSELLVLCICPEQKKFEFLHVGYHRQENNSDDDDDEEDGNEGDDDNVIEIQTNPTTRNATKTTNVQDLLQGLPKMCTDSIFVNATFDAIYRNNGVDKFFQKLDDWSLPLPECDFRENELVVVAIKGSSERAVLEGIGPILSNDRIMKTLKRGRRSRRSLKFVRSRRRRVKQRWRRLKLPSSSSSSSRKTILVRKGIAESKKSDTNDCSSTCSSTESKIDASLIDSTYSSSNDDLVDVYCHDYDPFNGISESKGGQLLLASITILLGTVIFSAFGL
jgi:hypothetical protein